MNTLPNFNQNTPLLIPSIYLAHRFSSLKLYPQNILCLIIVVLCLFVLKYLLFCDIIVMVQNHINQCKKELLCKNSEIAIISFEPSLLYPESLTSLSQTWKKNIFLLKDRESINMNKIPKESDPIIISNPNNVNGLEFKCVILVGVDEGRVPQTTGIGEVSANYIKYSAFNQLYLTSSRAKFRLILLGNSLHGTSPCLQYALENHRIELVE